jgi:hypothetical protein
MVKANELRIGNYITSKSALTHWEVMPADLQRIFNNEKHYMGITLTEEWLKNFGFKKTEAIFNDGFDAFILNGFGRICLKNGLLVSDEYYFLDGLKQEIKEVHQLQNLYFALTGNELTIK